LAAVRWKTGLSNKFHIIGFVKESKNKKTHSLTVNGVLEALKHSDLLCARKWGEAFNSAIFFILIFLYKYDSKCQEKCKNYIKNQNVIVRPNYFL
jgi:hypothetical protein